MVIVGLPGKLSSAGRVAGVVVVLLVAGGWALSRRTQPSPHEVASMRLSEAEAAMEAGDMLGARRLLEECLAAAPKHSQARLYYGQLLREAGQTAKALEIWESVREGTSEELATARFLEGTVAIERGRIDRSRDLMLAALRLDPHRLSARERLVSVFRMLRAPRRLTEQLDEIARQRPLTLEERIYRTIPDHAGYAPEDAIGPLKTSLNANPTDADCQFAYATVLRESGRADEALRFLSRIGRNGNRAESLLAEEILSKLELDRFEEVDCSQVDPDKAAVELCYACGRAAYFSGQDSRAATFLERVVRANPNHREACYMLSLMLERFQIPSAKTLAARVVQLDHLHRQCLRLTQREITDVSEAQPVLLQIYVLLREIERYAEAAEWYRIAMQGAPQTEWRQEYVKLLSQKEPEPFRQLRVKAGDLAPRARRVTPALRPAATESREDEPIEFEDVREQAGLDHQYFNGETGLFHLIESMGGGVIVLDYDGNAWPDLYFPQGCRLPDGGDSSAPRDRLYQNESNGHFRDVTTEAGLGSTRYGMGGLAFDYDNDGDDDLFVSNYGQCELYRNNGDGTFSDVSDLIDLPAEEMTTSVATGDFNNDGALDLYLANYVTGLKTCKNTSGGYAPCDPSDFLGQPDRLYVSDGEGGFRDASRQSGVTVAGGRGLGVVVADFDQDRRPDIYVANDGEPNFLFVNTTPPGANAPRFEERGIVCGAALDENGQAKAGMGIALGDFDGNSLPDVYVTNFYLEYNTLYQNLGQLQFVDGTRRADLVQPTLPMLGFGTQAVDLDSDGDLDLFVANGHIAHDPTGQQPWKMPAQLFQNRGDGVFMDSSRKAGSCFESKGLGRGVARLDWNRDGRCDLVVVYQDRPVALLENRTQPVRPKVTCRLVGTKSNREGLGAVVRWNDGKRDRITWRTFDGGYLASNSPDLYVDTEGSNEILVHVDWPSGQSTDHKLGTNRAESVVWFLDEGGGTHPDW